LGASAPEAGVLTEPQFPPLTFNSSKKLSTTIKSARD